MFQNAKSNEEKLVIIKFICEGWCNKVITNKQFKDLTDILNKELKNLDSWTKESRVHREHELLKYKEKLNTACIE